MPTNDDSMVRMIRNLLLNVDDCAPSIPLSIPKQAIEVAHTAEGETAATNEETSAIDGVMAEVSTANNTAAAATMQLECVFSSNSSSCDSSTGSSSSSRMSTELLKSRGDEDEADAKPFAKRSFECIPFAIEQSHPMIPRHGPLNGVVRKGDPLENRPAAKAFAIGLDEKRGAHHMSPSDASSTSSSSTDDDSLSSSSSSSSSGSNSSSSSSSSSTSSNSTML